MFEGVISTILKEDPFAIVAFLCLLLWGNVKMGKCKVVMTKEMQKHVSTEIGHLREIMEQKIHDQKKLLRTEINQNKEGLRNLHSND